MRALFCALLLGQAAWAQPVVQEVLPTQGKANGIIFLNGSGFGTAREGLKVLFGGVPGRVVSLQDSKLSVQVPWEAPKQSQVQVVTPDGASSNTVPFECLPSVRLTVDKNPLEVGESTTARFTVYHHQQPMMIFFKNASPEIVNFVGGNQQAIRTSGGPDNQATFTVVGIQGNRLYDVDYSWGKRSDEPVEWKLPWSQVPWTAKPEAPAGR